MAVLMVLSVSAVMAVSVMTATPLKLNPPFPWSWCASPRGGEWVSLYVLPSTEHNVGLRVQTKGVMQQHATPRRVLRRFFKNKCFSEGFLKGACKGSQSQEWPRQTKPKKGQFMNFSQGHSGTKVQCESCLFSQGKTPEFIKMGEIHELFVLALSLV